VRSPFFHDKIWLHVQLLMEWIAMESNKNFWLFFFKMAKPYRWWFFAMLFVGIYSSVHSVVQPYVLKVLLDGIAQPQDKSFIDLSLKPTLLLILLGFIITAVWRFYNFVVLKSLPRIKADIVTITTEHLRDQSYAFFQDELSGDMSAKISDLTSNIQNMLNSWFNISRQALTIFLSILMVGTVSLYFSFIFFVISIIFIFMSYYCANSIKPFASAYAKARAKNSGSIVDCFSNVLNMFLFSREKYESEFLANSTEHALREENKMQFKNMKNASVLGFFAWILQATSLIILLYLGNEGLMSVGDFAFIFILSITVIDQIWYLTENLLVVGEQAGICENALQTIFTDHLQKMNPPDAVLNITKGHVSLSNVNFEYNTENIVIDDFNFNIPGGTKVGLVGYSGAGKSTIVQLITKLYDLKSGEIKIDNQNISEINRRRLREQIAFIPQEPNLFHRSIKDNILYGRLDASNEELTSASKKAHAHEFIMSLPDGYNTMVGERGMKLSGGQRQRIAIARAILKDAPILILDEATSSLDSVTEKIIQKSLDTAMKNRTVIVIAHRLSTLLSMDNIAVMDKGRIIEMGSHQTLIEQGGFYKSLWDAQSGHSLI
jgi:ATP-binding cassette, subfamily B, bacterial